MRRVKGIRIFNLADCEMPKIGELFRVGPFVGICIIKVRDYAVMCVTMDNRTRRNNKWHNSQHPRSACHSKH